MKILILEDETIIAESLFQLLESMDYEPLEAVDTPEKAIAIINKEKPQLAILDVRLANERSGLEVASYLSLHHKEIPFIILTAHSDKHTIQDAKQYKPAAYLTKPFVRETLFAAIELAVPDAKENIITDEHTLFIKTGTRYEKISIEEIVYIQAKGKYTEIHFGEGKHLMRMSLATFVTVFKKIKWLRIHKSFFVNASYISSITANEVTVSNATLPIGRAYRADLIEKLHAIRSQQ